MRIRFKIISYSSEDKDFPITNLISGTNSWESTRFCPYPQQLTIQFYEPINLKQIDIVSHPYKISEKVHVVFGVVGDMANEVLFRNYGYVLFGNALQCQSKIKEMKKIQNVNENVLFVRFVLWKNHQNKGNFFNQVGLSSLAFYGESANVILPLTIKSPRAQGSRQDTLSSKMEIIKQLKEEFVMNDDFDNAKRIKEIENFVEKQIEKLEEIKSEKENAVQQEDFMLAKELKTKINLLEREITQLIDQCYDPDQSMVKPILKESRIEEKVEQILNPSSQVISSLPLEIATKGNISGNNYPQIAEELPEEMTERLPEDLELEESKVSISYDNRIIPTILNKKKRVESEADINNNSMLSNEFIESKEKEREIVLEEMLPSEETNSSFLLEFYEPEIVRKIHSKYWNFKVEGLGTVLEEFGKFLGGGGEIGKNRVKAVLYIFGKCYKEPNFQVSNLCLDLVMELVSTKKPFAKNVQSELKNELEKSVNELFLKMAENQRTKQKCSEICVKMLTSPLYGVPLLYQAIYKSYFNQTLTHNTKIKKHKLTILQNMVVQSQMGEKNGLPFSSIDFVCKAAEDSNLEIRKEATMILKLMKQRGGKDKVLEAVKSRQNLKTSILKELQS